MWFDWKEEVYNFNIFTAIDFGNSRQCWITGVNLDHSGYITLTSQDRQLYDMVGERDYSSVIPWHCNWDCAGFYESLLDPLLSLCLINLCCSVLVLSQQAALALQHHYYSHSSFKGIVVSLYSLSYVAVSVMIIHTDYLLISYARNCNSQASGEVLWRLQFKMSWGVLQ